MYVSYTNTQVATFTQTFNNLPWTSTLNPQHYILSLHRYGPFNLLGFGYRVSDGSLAVILFSGSSSLSEIMDYNIDPFPGSSVSSPVWEWHYQFLFIDYSNSQVIMPILSNYRSGFYYLRVQTSPACMIYPPISSCLSTGLPPTKTFDLLNKVYPHTCYGPYQAIQRATTIGNNIFTMSSCQLQSRSFPNPNLSMTPAGVINF